MHRTGKYKTINLVFGILPLCGLVPIIFLREDSGFMQKWFSVVPIGFGNAVVFQTVLSKSLYAIGHLDVSLIASFWDSCAAGSFIGYVRTRHRNKKSDVYVVRQESQMAFGTAFGQLFRGLGKCLLAPVRSVHVTHVHYTGQTSGVAIASAVFQSRLDAELHHRIHMPGAERVRAIFSTCSLVGAD